MHVEYAGCQHDNILETIIIAYALNGELYALIIIFEDALIMQSFSSPTQ